MKDYDRGLNLFPVKRCLNYLSKFFLEVLERLKSENFSNIEKISKSLEETEIFVKERHGIDLNLTTLVKHINFLDENKFLLLRKEILDRANDLNRSIQNEYK